MRWLDGFVQHEPRPGVDYLGILVVDDPKRTPLRAMALGVGASMLALIGFLWLAGVVTAGLGWLGWLASGSPGPFQEYYQTAISDFTSPLGMLAANLGSASAIPLMFALVLVVHRFHPRWLHSVQPGFRWRYAAVTTLLAVVVLGGIWVLSRIGQPWVYAPEQPMWGFLLVILLTAPLQAAGEEYLLRGFLLQSLYSAAPNLNRPLIASGTGGQGMARIGLWIARGYQRWFGVVGAALLFALLHTQNQGLPGLLHPFFFGLIAGWLVLKTGGLEAAIAAHVVNNVLAFGYATLSGTMYEARHPGEVGWAELAWNLAAFLLFAIAAAWVARRMNLATRTPAAGLAGGSRL